MEKIQHNSSTENTESLSTSGLTGNQPGQQIPAGNNSQSSLQENASETKEQHSESSFPQQEGETLGTP
jgi:hypothetical protein